MFNPTLKNPPLQEILQRQTSDPWRVAVACILLNKTGRAQVDRVWPALFERFPVSGALAYQSEDGELEALLRPLGLQDRRARTLQRMSHEWTVRPENWRSDAVFTYHGLGGYAQESHDVFVLGRLNLLPVDPVVAAWVRLLRGTPPAWRPLRYRAAVSAAAAAAMAAG